MVSDMESSVYGKREGGANAAWGSTLREKFGSTLGSGRGCTQVGEDKAQSCDLA